jgi:hypothetical protein
MTGVGQQRTFALGTRFGTEMKELRLAWEPDNRTPLAAIEERMRSYGVRQGVTILGNGTLLFITGGEDDEADARRALNEARFMTDFRTVELKEGGYMVAFHDAVAVFVDADEFEERRSEVEARLSDLRFPEEHFFVPDDSGRDATLVGLYARGKLQRDCYHFRFFKRI